MKEEISKQSAKFTGKVFYHTSRSVVGHLLGACDCNVPRESHFNVIVLQQGFSSESHKKSRKFLAFQGQQWLDHNRALMPWPKGIGNGMWAEIQVLPVQNFVDFYSLEDSKSSTEIQARLRN